MVDGLIRVLDDPTRHARRACSEIVKGPDFPTRGYIYGTAGIRDAYATGRGIITMRARAHTEKLRGGREAIVVTELPYQVNKATLIAKIAELSREGKLDGLSEIRDESDRHGIRVVLELAKGEIAQIVLNQLYKHTAMQSTFGVIMLALVGRRPQVVTLRQMLDHFIDFRREVVVRRTRYDLARAEERAHILEGLRKALDHLDLVIRLIRAAASVDAARDALMTQLAAQRDPGEGDPGHAAPAPDPARAREGGPGAHRGAAAHRAAARDPRAPTRSCARSSRRSCSRSRRSTGTSAGPRSSRSRSSSRSRTSSPTRRWWSPSRAAGYIKRTAVEAYRSQRRGGKGVTGMETKEEDVVENVYIASTHAYLLFFTNDGKVHWLKVHEIPEAKRDARGKAIVNLLHLAEGERVAATLSVRDFTTGGYIFFATRQGRVKKTELTAYSRPQRGGIRAITLDEGDEVMAVRLTDGQREVLLATRRGMAIRFSEEEVRPMGRAAAGVKGIDVDADDAVIAAEVVEEGAAILTVTERGLRQADARSTSTGCRAAAGRGSSTSRPAAGTGSSSGSPRSARATTSCWSRRRAS